MRLTDEQIEYARRVANIRRRIVARLKKLPTNEKLAEELGCSERYIDSIVTMKARKSPRGTSVSPNCLDEIASAHRD